MTKQAIIQDLQQQHDTFLEYMTNLTEADFMFSLDDEKWTAGQEIDHIIKSTSPLILAFKLPKMAMKMQFGTANRPSRSYEGVVNRYHEKLANLQGFVPPKRFAPPTVAFQEREKICHKLRDNVEKLSKLISRQSEEDLDKYILPHPLLGKLTLREMLYFTCYHVGHHQANSTRNLAARSVV